MSKKVFSVRVVKALMEDCLADGIGSLSENELLEILEIRPTTGAVDLGDSSALEVLSAGQGESTPAPNH